MSYNDSYKSKNSGEKQPNSLRLHVFPAPADKSVVEMLIVTVIGSNLIRLRGFSSHFPASPQNEFVSLFCLCFCVRLYQVINWPWSRDSVKQPGANLYPRNSVNSIDLKHYHHFSIFCVVATERVGRKTGTRTNGWMDRFLAFCDLNRSVIVKTDELRIRTTYD